MSAPSPSDPRFFQADLKSVPKPFAQLLTTYSQVPSDEQIKHIVSIRDKAYKARQYPCLGRFRFLDLNLSTHPLYQSYILPLLTSDDIKDKGSSNDTVKGQQVKLQEDIGSEGGDVRSLQEGPIFLDLSSCLSQDLRKLAFDGVPPSRLYASDIESEFIPLGYELFRDEKLIPPSHFLVPGDVFSLSNSGNRLSNTTEAAPADKLQLLDDKVDVLNASAIFHLFNLDEQKDVARRCLKLLRKDQHRTPTSPPPLITMPSDNAEESITVPRTTDTDTNTTTTISPGKFALITGGQAGNVNAATSTRANGRSVYRHNLQSWTEMWEDVVGLTSSSSTNPKETGTRTETETKTKTKTKTETEHENEWKSTVKSIYVDGFLSFSEYAQYRDAAKIDQTGGTGAGAGNESGGGEGEREPDRYAQGEGDGKTEWNSMVVGKYEDGFRWHVFWIWVEFY